MFITPSEISRQTHDNYSKTLAANAVIMYSMVCDKLCTYPWSVLPIAHQFYGKHAHVRAHTNAHIQEHKGTCPTHVCCGNLPFCHAQPLCLPFSLLRHLRHVSLNPDLVAFFRVLKGWMKATSKLRPPHQSADRPPLRMRGWFLRDNAAMPPAYRVRVHNCASFVDISRSV